MYSKHIFKYLLLFCFFIVLAAACKNKPATDNEGNDTAVTDSTQGTNDADVIQHNFPESPVNITHDTTFLVDGKAYVVSVKQKTIDTSPVVFTRKAMGKSIKDVYYDFEYFITPKSPDYKGGGIKVTKHNFRKEFNDDFFNYSVLYQLEILGFNTTNKEFEFSFLINKPDTDNTFKIYFFINNKGETHYEVEDLVS